MEVLSLGSPAQQPYSSEDCSRPPISSLSDSKLQRMKFPRKLILY